MKSRIAFILVASFLLTVNCSADDGKKTLHYNNGSGWLHFEYPASFVMDPKSHVGESKWWARLVAPDQSLSIETWSFGYCSEAIKEEEKINTPEEYILRHLLKGTPTRTKHDGYDTLIRVDSGSATVIFLHTKAEWGRCYQQLKFTFPEGSYETHRPTIMQVVESAVPSIPSASEQDGEGRTGARSDAVPEMEENSGSRTEGRSR